MVSAATMFRKSGFNDSDAAMLAKVAAQYQNVADTAVSSEDAASSIVSQIRAFGEDASFATTVIDAYNEVANNFSVGTNDLSKAMEVASSGLATYGNEFSEILGLVTAGTEIMTGRSSQVARGLSTIAARIVKNKDALAEYGITVENTDGSLKSTFDVLSELKPKWDSMTDAQRTALGDTIAGTNQYKVLAAVMSNFNTAVDANKTALNSSGSAAKENARYMESLESQITAVKASFQDFANNVISKDLISAALQATNAFLNFANNGLGTSITQATLFSGVALGLVGVIGQIATRLGDIFSRIGALGALGLSGGQVAAIIAGVVGGLTLLVSGIKALKDAIDNATPSYEKLVKEFEDSKDALDQTKQDYSDARDRLKELNEIPWADRTSEMQDEIEQLKDLIEYYELLKDYRKSEAIADAKELLESPVTTSTTASFIMNEYLHDVRLADGTSRFSGVFRDHEAAVRAAADAIEVYDVELGRYVTLSQWATAQVAQNTDEANGYADAVSLMADELASIGVYFSDTTQNSNQFAQSQATIIRSLTGWTESAKNGAMWQEKMSNQLAKSKDQYEAMNLLVQEADGDTSVLTDSQRNLYEAYQNGTAVLYKYTGQLDGLSEALGISSQDAKELASSLSEMESSAEESNEALETAANYVNGWTESINGAIGAKQAFDDAMEATGDYDDAFKELSSVFSTLKSELENGQAASLTTRNALAQLVSPDILAQYDAANDKVAFMNEQIERLTMLYGESESGGMGFISVMQQLADAGSLAGATLAETSDGISYTITDLDALAQSMGLTTGQLFSLIEASKVFGNEVNWDVAGLISSFETLGVEVVDVGNGIKQLDFGQIAEAYAASGATVEEIRNIQYALEDADGIQLTNIPENLSDIVSKADDSQTAAQQAKSDYEALDGVSLDNLSSQISGVTAQTRNATQAANNLLRAFMNVSRAQSRVDSNAEGTSYAKAGPSFINEEGPELVRSGNKAYIPAGGKPAIVNLKEGDQVFTAEETAKILKGRFLTGSIQSHAQVKTSGSGVIRRGTRTYSSASYSGSSGGSSTSSSGSSTSRSDTYSSSLAATSSKDDEFTAWLKAKKHALEMDIITEAEYYRELEKMNDQYYKGKLEYQDEYWKYQEEIYKWEKKQAKAALQDQLNALKDAQDAIKNKYQDQLNALKDAQDAINNKYDVELKKITDVNDALDDRIEYEKLLENLAKAKASKQLVFKNGRYQYMQDLDAISAAQGAIYDYNREKQIEAKKEAIEKRRQQELDKIAKQQEEINKKLSSLTGYASGTLSAAGGISMVGENGPEMRILNRGDGILNTNTTINLLKWSRITPQDMMMRASVDKNVDGLVFNNTTMSFPNISTEHDAKKFVESVKSLAYQRAYHR